MIDYELVANHSRRPSGAAEVSSRECAIMPLLNAIADEVLTLEAGFSGQGTLALLEYWPVDPYQPRTISRSGWGWDGKVLLAPDPLKRLNPGRDVIVTALAVGLTNVGPDLYARSLRNALEHIRGARSFCKGANL